MTRAELSEALLALVPADHRPAAHRLLSEIVDDASAAAYESGRVNGTRNAVAVVRNHSPAGRIIADALTQPRTTEPAHD